MPERKQAVKRGPRRRIHAGQMLLCLLGMLGLFYLPSKAQQRPLRLYWQARPHLNPLLTRDPSGQAAMQLLYAGLFRLDEREALHYDLLHEAHWSADRMRLQLSLRQDRSFSNGDPITAEDVAYSLLVYRYSLLTDGTAAPPEDAALQRLRYGSPDVASLDPEREEALKELHFPETEELAFYDVHEADPDGKKAFAAISLVQVLNEHQVIIHLNGRADHLPWYLRSPIVPKADVFREDMTPIPSSGRYQIRSIDAQQILSLEARASVHQDKPILLQPYASQEAALEALEEEAVDVVYVGAEDFASYGKRSDIGKRAFKNLRYGVLLPGHDPAHLLSQEALFRAYRHASRLALHGDKALPLHGRDYRRDYFCERPSLPEKVDVQAFYQAIKGQRLLLLALEGAESRRVLARVSEELSKMGAKVEREFVSQEAYAARVQSGRYDLLFHAETLSLPSDPLLLVDQLLRLRPDLKAHVPARQHEDALLWARFYLFDVHEAASSPLRLQACLSSLEDYLAALPLLHLGFFEEGLLYARGLDVTFQGAFWEPYDRLEEMDRWPVS